MKALRSLLVMGAQLMFVAGLAQAAPESPADAGPHFNAAGELERPEGYRGWVFLNTALSLTYGPNRAQAGQPQPFTSVFVNPRAWQAFQRTGLWPDGTIFALEVRPAIAPPSATPGALTQGPRVALEVAVRDSARYPDGGWAYFSFDGPRTDPQALRTRAAPFPRTAGCYGCHAKHAAVQWTFTQFYAEEFARARQLGTVRADYDAQRLIDEVPH